MVSIAMTGVEMTAEELHPDDRYTIKEVKALLALYPYMLDARPPKDPAMTRVLSSIRINWELDAAIRRAEISRALKELQNDRAPRIDSASGNVLQYVLRARFIVGIGYDHIASYLLRCEPELQHRRHLDAKQVVRWESIALRRVRDILNGVNR